MEVKIYLIYKQQSQRGKPSIHPLFSVYINYMILHVVAAPATFVHAWNKKKREKLIRRYGEERKLFSFQPLSQPLVIIL